MARLVVIGGGRMGAALVGGLLDAGWAEASELVVAEIDPTRRDELRAEHGVGVSAEPVAADGAVVALKPADAASGCREAVAAGAGRVLSIAAGVTLASLQEAAGPGVPVVRAMPNTPALVGQGASAIAGGEAAGDEDLAWAEGILSSVGTVVRVPEPQLDAVTGLSGSGPAYVFLLAEALVDAGVLVGLPRDVATALATQTLLGSATLLAASDDGATALRAAVTSPGGTTAAGLRALEVGGLRAAVLDAVAAATERSRQLGG